MDIKPIETRWRNYRFRSRTEARWGIFWDSAGKKFDYEKEGYELPSGRYLPDFWLQESKMWCEVKGTEPTELELDKCRELRDLTNSPVILVQGQPGDHRIWLFCWEISGSGGGSCEFDSVTLAIQGTFPLAFLIDGAGLGISFFRDCGMSEKLPCIVHSGGYTIHEETGIECQVPLTYTIIENAIAAAKSARFEHGEM